MILNFVKIGLNRNYIHSLLKKFSSYMKKHTQNIISKENFDKKGLYLIYKSTEKKIFILTSGFLLYGLYHLNLFYKEQENSNLVLGLFMTGFYGLIYFRMIKTPKNIWLYNDGKTINVEFFRFFGFFSQIIPIPINNFRGHQVWGVKLLKKLNFPIATYQMANGKRKYFFFKTDFVIDETNIKEIFCGKEFKIISENMNFDISNKKKKNYNF